MSFTDDYHDYAWRARACVCVRACVWVYVCVVAGIMCTSLYVCRDWIFMATFCLSERANLSLFEWNENSPFGHLTSHRSVIFLPQRNAGHSTPEFCPGQNVTSWYELYLNSRGILYRFEIFKSCSCVKESSCLWVPYLQLLFFLMAPPDLTNFSIWEHFLYCQAAEFFFCANCNQQAWLRQQLLSRALFCSWNVRG